MLLDIGRGLADEEAAAVLALLLLFLLLCGPAQMVHRSPERLVDLVHFRGLEQKARHTQADRLLGIAEIPITGEDDHLHVREFAAQSRQHGQAVVARHADIGKEDVRPHFPDHRGALHRILRRGNDFTGIVAPLDDLAKALHDQSLIVDQNHSVHTKTSFSKQTLIFYSARSSLHLRI